MSKQLDELDKICNECRNLISDIVANDYKEWAYVKANAQEHLRISLSPNDLRLRKLGLISDLKTNIIKAYRIIDKIQDAEQ